MNDIRFTSKQIEIMNIIKEGNPDGSRSCVYDIQQNLSYEVKRDALLHSLKILIDNGYVERRAREKRTGFKQTVATFCVTTKAAEII